MTEAVAAGRTAVVAHPDSALTARGELALQSLVGLVEAGWRVVLALRSPGPLGEAARAAGADVAVLDFSALRTASGPASAVAEALSEPGAAGRPIADLLRRVRPDVVYVTSARLPLWIVHARLLRLPVVVHVHDPEGAASRRVRGAIARTIGADGVVVVGSEASRAGLLGAAPGLADRAVVVHSSCVHPPLIRPARERLEGRLHLLAAGDDQAGLAVAVNALGLLLGRGLDVDLEVRCGSGHEPDRWTALRARADVLGLGDRVAFHALEAESWEAIADADMVLLPSGAHGSRTDIAVQALVSGRPVAVSETGSVTETITGFASAIPVPPGDAPALAAAVERVATTWTAFRRMAAATAPMAMRQYSAVAYRRAMVSELTRAARSAERRAS
ncbi:glycosyltransferase [uncultured Amnibacterium sp.]|uniref:glycosyltransferase n=1 Tax=uncultured Amnibacterium sp. TaxID=1631851 RepID=UPI0035CBC44F